jgi:hypothetical protein
MWTQPADSLIFRAFRDDVPVTRSLPHPPGSRAAAGEAPVVVLNGTPRPGLQESDYGRTTRVGNPVMEQPVPRLSPRTATQNICT